MGMGIGIIGFSWVSVFSFFFSLVVCALERSGFGTALLLVIKLRVLVLVVYFYFYCSL